MSSKIFETKYQKAGKWRLVLCVGVIELRVTFMLFFGGVTATGKSVVILISENRKYYNLRL